MVDSQETRLGLRERKKDRTRTALLDAALTLFAAKSFADTTINQIAAEVDVSARTLLRYFPTKEDIVVSQVEESMDVFRACFEDRPTDEPVYISLLASARALISHYEAQSHFFLAIERAIAASPEIRARKLAMSAGLADQLADMISQRKQNPKVTKWEARLYTDLVFSLVRAVIGRWVEEDGRPSLEAMFKEASALITFSSG